MVKLDRLIKSAQAQLYASQVLENSHATAVLFRKAANIVDYFLVLGKGPVGEIEPGAVHSGKDKPFQGVRVPGDRPDSGDNLGLSHCELPHKAQLRPA